MHFPSISLLTLCLLLNPFFDSLKQAHSAQVPNQTLTQVKQTCQTPKLAEVGWTDIAATTAVTSLLLEGLGYQPKVHLLSIPITFASLKNKDVDIFLGNWQPTMKQDIAPYLKQKVVESPWINLKGAKYTLAVPRYVYEGGVRSVTDLQKFKDKFAQKIYGIEPGNDGNRLLFEMIQKNYAGLKDWSLVESSEQGMLTQVLKSVKRKKWVVFLGWAPHPMNKKIDMEYLGGAEDYFGANKGESIVYTTIRKNYIQECPQVADLLKNLQFNLEMENSIMQEIIDNRLGPAQAAANWLKANPESVKTWLKKIKALDGRDGFVAVNEYLNSLNSKKLPSL